MTAHEDSNFERAYAVIHEADLSWVHGQLIALGNWPYERIPMRVLGNIEAANILKNRMQAVLALAKAIVVIVDQEGKIYTARTADVVSGVRKIHHVMADDKVIKGVEGVFGAQ